jgi:DNA-binding NarL/FixJ family response regulator
LKVVIIDDEKAMHLIMTSILKKIDKVEVVGTFQETKTAFEFLQANEVDIAFIDINMPRESGLDFAKRLRELYINMKLVFVTSHKEYALAAFDVYAYDYMIKPVSKTRVMETVERVLAEKGTNSRDLIGARNTNLTGVPSLIEPLTKREKEILILIGKGLSNKEIAGKYSLREGTIKNHIFNIYGKLQVKNRVQAMVTARELRLID